MTQALAKVPTTPPPAVTKPSALNFMAGRLNCDPAKLLSTLKATVFKGANDDEIMALVLVSNEYQLNPLLKEIYAFPAKGGGITPIVSVDGWNKMLIRQEAFDGIQFDFAEDERGFPRSCTATVHVKGRSHPVVVTEYFDECQRNTDNWKNMPRRMLRNRTRATGRSRGSQAHRGHARRGPGGQDRLGNPSHQPLRIGKVPSRLRDD
jgi:phage recombination protein Bet